MSILIPFLSTRPKTAGTIGQMKRSLSTSSVGTPAPELKLAEGMSVFCNNELGMNHI